MPRDDTVDKIRQYTDIVSLAEEYFPLRRAGVNYKALCPFHQEKTASFVVSPDKQIFHCFGCGQSGDVFSFIMQLEGVDFPEALRRLADRSNIKLEINPEGVKQKQLSDEIYGVNERAAAFYSNCLYGRQGAAALKYLESRGITEKEISRFGIGYAPGPDTLVRKAVSGGVSGNLLETADLAVRDASGRLRDKFLKRIIFPIHDERGRVAGFGGRVIEEERLPKYLNTAQTKVFEKRQILYGLYFAKKEIREKRRVILLEGYMDVISAHQFGFPEAVAALGTSLTSEHIYRIKRLADEVILAFDSDAAGGKATSRGLDAVIESDMPGRVCVLPAGKDPEDVIREDPESFRLLLEGAKPLVEWRIDYALKAHEDITDRSVRKSRAVRDLIPVVEKVADPVERSEAVKLLSEKLKVPEAAVRQEMRRHMRGEPSYVKEKLETGRIGREDKIARELLHAVMLNPEYAGELSVFLEEYDLNSSGLYAGLLKDYIVVYGADIHRMMAEAGEDGKRVLAQLSVSKLNSDSPAKYLKALMRDYEKSVLEKKFEEVSLEITRLIHLNKPVEDNILSEFKRLSKIFKAGRGRVTVNHKTGG